MKKFFIYLSLLFLLCFFFDMETFAAISTNEADFICEVDYPNYNMKQSHFKSSLTGKDVYTVYYSDTHAVNIFTPKSDVRTYYMGINSSYLPAQISDSQIFSGIKMAIPDIKYDLYSLTNFSFAGYSYISENFDFVFESESAFYQELAQYDTFEDFLNHNSRKDDENKLPMLHYKISSKNVISFPNIVDKKISIDWDFSNLEPYASDPMAYALEIIISAHFYPNSEGKRICWDAADSSINNSYKRYLDKEASLLDKPFSFIYFREGDALYSLSNHIFATDELQDGYYLYIRSYSLDGSKSSNYKVYKCTTGGVVGQMDISYDTDGNQYELDDEDKDEDSDYSNEYDSDSSSSADKTPTGDSYDGNGGYSFDTLYGNLTSMVNMLQGVPELWMHVMSWLPSWFPVFIVTMMGLLIVIGVLKYIF